MMAYAVKMNNINYPGNPDNSRKLTDLEEAAYLYLTKPKYSKEWLEAQASLDTITTDERENLLNTVRMLKKYVCQAS